MNEEQTEEEDTVEEPPTEYESEEEVEEEENRGWMIEYGPPEKHEEEEEEDAPPQLGWLHPQNPHWPVQNIHQSDPFIHSLLSIASGHPPLRQGPGEGKGRAPYYK